MTEPLQNERGIALIITLLVVAILTITVMEFTFSAHVDQVMGRNALYSLQATLLARSGINRGEAILLADQELQYDSYLEDWGRIEELDSQMIIPDNMLLKIRVVDEAGKLNINRTRPAASQCKAFLSETPNALSRMWITALQHLDPQVAVVATDYWTKVCENIGEVPATGQPQGTRTPTGGAAAPTPTPPTEETPGTQDWNSYLHDFPTLDDAAAQMGFSTAAVRRLRPYVTALPTTAGGADKVNINTASARVLAAIYGDESVAHDIIAKRQDAPLTTLGEFSAANGSGSSAQAGDATTNPSLMLKFTSSFFLVRASAIVNPNPTTGRGGIRRSASMLVQRKQRPGQSASVQQGSGQGGARRFTLTQLDWQKEGGAELFTEKREDETGGEDTPDSQLAAPMGG